MLKRHGVFNSLALALALLVWADAAAAGPLAVVVALVQNGVALGAALTATFGAVGAFAIRLGASALISKLTARRPQGPDAAREIQSPNSLPPYRFAYGDKPVFGSWVPIRAKDEKYIYGCMIFNSRPSDALTGLIFDKRNCVLTGDPYDFSGPGATAVTDPFTDHLNVWFGLGDQTTVPAVFLAEAPEFYQSTDVWRGRTIAWMKIRNGKSKNRNSRWPTFPPEIEGIGRWSKVWDCNDVAQDPDDPDTWEWSANQGLVLLDVLRQNPIETYDLANLHLDSFKLQAAHAAEAVALKAGGFEPRYEAHGLVIFNGSELTDLIEPIAEAGGCRMFTVGGLRGVIPGGPRDSIYTITDVIGSEMEFVDMRPGRDMPNLVTCTYVSVDRGMEMAALPPYLMPGALAADGGKERPLVLELPYVASPSQAMRIQKYRGLEARLQAGLTGILPPDAIDLVTGSVVTAALPAPFDVFNGPYEVQSATPTMDVIGESGVALRIPVELRGYSDDIWGWVAATDEVDIEDEDFDGNLADVIAPGTITVSTGAGSDLDTGGTVLPRLRFAFDPVAGGGVQSYEWEYQITTAGSPGASDNWTAGGFIDADIRDAGNQVFGYVLVSIGRTYDIRVRTISTYGQSDWTTVTGLSTSMLISGGAAAAGFATVLFTGTGPVNPNMAGYKVYRGTTNVFSAAVQVGSLFAGSSGAAYSVRIGPATITDLITNGVFAADTNWTKGTGWTIAGGVADKIAGAGARLLQTLALTAGHTYRIGADVVRSAGTLTAELFGSTTVSGSAISASGRLSESLVCPASPISVRFLASSTFVGTLDNVVMFEEIAGMVAHGAAYFWIVPVTTTGLLGTPDGPYALNIT